jgi:hypothetical protein
MHGQPDKKFSIIYVTLIASGRKNKNAPKNITCSTQKLLFYVATHWVHKVYIHCSRNVKLEMPTNLHEIIILGNEFQTGEIKVKR